MNATKTIAKALVKTVLCVAVVAGTLTFATGCEDDYLGFGSGFRFGNFNQGLPGTLDCHRNPWDPRC